MQLGTRWSVGQDPPAALPETLVVAVRQVEEELADAGVDASTWRWTLTYLERRPVAELDDGTTIRQAADGSVTVSNPEQDWA